MTKNKIIRKNGELTVQFKFRRTSSMLEMEEQIESLIDSLDEKVSELEKNSIRSQLLSMLKDEGVKNG